MDRQAVLDALAEMERLKALLLVTIDEPAAIVDANEASSTDTAAAVVGPKSNENLLKRVAVMCESTQQKLNKCQQKAVLKVDDGVVSKNTGETSTSSAPRNGDNAIDEPGAAIDEPEAAGDDANEASSTDNGVVSESTGSASTTTDPAKDSTTSKGPVVAFKLRPIEELLDTAAKDIRPVVIDSDSDSGDTALAHRSDLRTSSSRNRIKPPAIKLKPILKRATSKQEPTAAAAGPSGCSDVRVVLRRLPNDLSKLLHANGLEKELRVVKPRSEGGKSKAQAERPNITLRTRRHVRLSSDNENDTTTMPRKRSAPQKVSIVQELNSDDEAEDVIVPITGSTSTNQLADIDTDDEAPTTTAASNGDGVSADEETYAPEPNSSNDDDDFVAKGKPAAARKSARHHKSATDDDEDFSVMKRKRKPAAKQRKKSLSDASDSESTKPATKKRRRIKKTTSDDDDSGGGGGGGQSARNGSADDSGDDADGSKARAAGRKNIRKVIKLRDLESDTKRAAREEAERKRRIEERQKLYNSYYDDEEAAGEKATNGADGGEGSSSTAAAGGVVIKQETPVKVLDKLILDFDEKTKEELISVDRQLVRRLKPHQGNGVKFMWDTCFESIERIQCSPGSGCILAHCMGLGKTLQVVTLVHTLLAHSDETSVEKVLVICPLSTVLNWVNEFKMWLKQCADNRDVEIYEISKYKQNYERVYQINEWHQEGGVLIMGYDMFRNLSSETSRLKKREKEKVRQALIDPGADLVVCDEGHLLKNSKTSLSKAVNRIRTLRRVVLTGTPLQNNLNEYYCMVQFVKPNLLGKYNEYLNRFVNPITNGQYVDSTPYDIQMMKRRSHILHKMLDGCVQRRDYAVLAPYLPVKHEYVVYVRLTPLQCALYRYYMQHKPVSSTTSTTRSSVLFQDFQNLQRIWTHPRVLRFNSDRFEIAAQKKRDAQSDSEGSLKDFIDDTDEESSAKSTPPGSDGEDDDEDVMSDDSLAAAKRKTKTAKGMAAAGSSAKASTSDGRAGLSTRRTRAKAEPEPEPAVPEKHENPTEWWMSMCPEEELDELSHSGKLMLIFSLLEECEQIGDKLLVFSQSLYSLDVIENFLSKIDDCTQRCNRLKPRRPATLDSDADDDAEPDANMDPEMAEVLEERRRLGGFSGSWSPGLDYFRLDGSTNIENRNLACKSFNREDNPRARLFLISTRAGGLGINLVAANRVVIFDVSWNPSHDIQSIFRVYRFGQKKPCYIYRFIAMGTMEEKVYERQVTKLAISKRVIDEHQIDRHYKENDLMELYKSDLEPTEEPPIPILPKDRLFAGQLKKFEKIIYKYHEHESLLENKQEETLNEAEIKAAWEEFEAEKKARPPVNYMPQQRAPGTGPVTSNHIFGIRSDVMLQLLRIYARKIYPTADENQIKQLVPLLLQQLYEKMQTGDTSMLQQLMKLQQELEAPPNFAFNSNLPAFQQMQHPQAHMQPQTIHSMQQQQPMINPFNAMAANNGSIMQMAHMTPHQQMIAQAQNRLLKEEARQQLANRPPPTISDTIIELD